MSGRGVVISTVFSPHTFLPGSPFEERHFSFYGPSFWVSHSVFLLGASISQRGSRLQKHPKGTNADNGHQ